MITKKVSWNQRPASAETTCVILCNHLGTWGINGKLISTEWRALSMISRSTSKRSSLTMDSWIFWISSLEPEKGSFSCLSAKHTAEIQDTFRALLLTSRKGWSYFSTPIVDMPFVGVTKKKSGFIFFACFSDIIFIPVPMVYFPHLKGDLSAA